MTEIGFLNGISFHDKFTGMFQKHRLPVTIIRKEPGMELRIYRNNPFLHRCTIIEERIILFEDLEYRVTRQYPVVQESVSLRRSLLPVN